MPSHPHRHTQSSPRIPWTGPGDTGLEAPREALAGHLQAQHPPCYPPGLGACPPVCQSPGILTDPHPHSSVMSRQLLRSSPGSSALVIPGAWTTGLRCSQEPPGLPSPREMQLGGRAQAQTQPGLDCTREPQSASGQEPSPESTEPGGQHVPGTPQRLKRPPRLWAAQPHPYLQPTQGRTSHLGCLWDGTEPLTQLLLRTQAPGREDPGLSQPFSARRKEGGHTNQG